MIVKFKLSIINDYINLLYLNSLLRYKEFCVSELPYVNLGIVDKLYYVT